MKVTVFHQKIYQPIVPSYLAHTPEHLPTFYSIMYHILHAKHVSPVSLLKRARRWAEAADKLYASVES